MNISVCPLHHAHIRKRRFRRRHRRDTCNDHVAYRVYDPWQLFGSEPGEIRLDAALEHFDKACRLGLDQKKLKTIASFPALQINDRFRRLLEQGLIEELAERPDPEHDDERRRYYRLTDLGRQVAMTEARRLPQLLADARASGLLPKGS